MKIAIYNNKGGAGKSTLTSHIAFRAIELQEPLTVVDIDRQRNTMSWLSSHQKNEPFDIGEVRVTNDPAELNTSGIVLIDCPPSFNVVEELKELVDLWLIPVDGRFSVDGSLNILSELRGKRSVIIINKAQDSKFGKAELKQIQQVPTEIFQLPIPSQDVVRKAEMLGVSAWKVPYGTRSTTAQNLRFFADWVLQGADRRMTYNKSEIERGVYA